MNGFTRTLLLATGTLLCAHASAQVTLYGRIDTGVEYLSNVGPSSTAVTRMPTLAGSSPSLWGLRVKEDLGAGIWVESVLEGGFAADQGTSGQGGRLLGRQATVGLAAPWGTLSLGRQYTTYYWVTTKVELLGPNIYGIGQFDPYYAGPRADNSVAYQGTFGRFTLGATYSLGRDSSGGCGGETAGDAQACRGRSWMLKYDAEGWGAAVAQDTMRGGSGATTTNGSPTSMVFDAGMSDQRTVLNGYAKVGSATLSAAWFMRENDAASAQTALTAKSAFWELAASVPLTPKIVLAGEAGRLRYRGSVNGSSAVVLAVRAMYGFSPRTAMYINVSDLRNRGSANLSVSGGTSSGTAPGAGERQHGLMLGMRHSF